MHHPDRISATKSEGVNHPIGVAMEPQRRFQHAGPEALEQLSYIRVAALGNDGQGAGKFDLRPLGTRLELFPRRPDPLYRPRCYH